MTTSKKPQAKREKTGGRTAKTEVLIASSNKQAANLTGKTVEDVKLAREMGCIAFINGNRIVLKDLREFFETAAFIQASEELADSIDWKYRLDKAKALTVEFKLKVSKGEYWDSNRVKSLITAGDRAMLDTLRKYMENEQPPLVEGKSAGQILAINKKWMDEVISDMRDSRASAMREASAGLPDEEETD